MKNEQRTTCIKRSAATLIIVSLLVSTFGCSSITTPPNSLAANSSTSKPVAVAVAPVRSGPVTAGHLYSGEMKAKTQVNVAAKLMGRIEQMPVEVGSVVKTGDVIAVLERGAIEAQLRQAEAALTLAKDRLEQMEAGARPEQVAQAEANLRAAEAKLAQLKAGPTAEQLQAAEAQVRLAKNQLYAVQTQADAYLASRAAAVGQLVYTKEMKEAQSGVAWEQVQLAEAQLAQLKAGPTPEQLAQAQAAVDAAKAQLDLAKSPFTQKDLEIARAQVAQAQTAVDLVKTQMADTTVTSPIDGIISERYLSVGGLAAPNVPIVTVTSLDLEASLAIEEARIGQVQAGQPVTATVSAYPDEQFEGVVTSVAPTVDPKTRTVTAKVEVKDPQRRLKAGMLARVMLGSGSSNGLFIPVSAVTRRNGKDIVFVVNDGRAAEREIRIGEPSQERVEVIEGLAAGEMVVLEPQAELTNGTSVTVIRSEQ